MERWNSLSSQNGSATSNQQRRKARKSAAVPDYNARRLSMRKLLGNARSGAVARLSAVLAGALSGVFDLAASAEVNLAPGAHAPTVRIEGHLDSCAALLLVVATVVIAGLLNARQPTSRALGTSLAALACFTVSAWFFFFVLPSGVLADPKPNQTPMDSAKPLLLWVQAIAATLSGLLLALAARSQRAAGQTLELAKENTTERYGRRSRMLHWTIAILFIALIPMGVFASMIPEGATYRNAYYVVHKTLGVVVTALVIVRLFWNRRSKRPGLDSHLKPLERKLAHGVHLTLYFMMIAMPVTGWVMTSFHGYPTFFFAWELQPLWAPSDKATIIWGTLHKYLIPYLIYLILGSHILGALKHHYIDRRAAALQRMVG